MKVFIFSVLTLMFTMSYGIASNETKGEVESESIRTIREVRR